MFGAELGDADLVVEAIYDYKKECKDEFELDLLN